MIAEYEKAVTLLESEHGTATMDASFASQTRIWMNRLKRKWDKIFNAKASEMAEKFVSQVDLAAKRNLDTSLKELSGGITIKTPDMPGDMRDKIVASTAENVALIKSIPVEFHARIEGAAFRSIRESGEGARTLLEEIRHTGMVTEKRARFIAVDQTRKITTASNRERMKAAGIHKAVWGHSRGGAEKRELHLKLNGETIDLDNPPVIDERTGQRGLPGDLPGCKCFLRPAIDFGDST